MSSCVSIQARPPPARLFSAINDKYSAHTGSPFAACFRINSTLACLCSSFSMSHSVVVSGITHHSSGRGEEAAAPLNSALEDASSCITARPAVSPNVSSSHPCRASALVLYPQVVQFGASVELYPYLPPQPGPHKTTTHPPRSANCFRFIVVRQPLLVAWTSTIRQKSSLSPVSHPSFK